MKNAENINASVFHFAAVLSFCSCLVHCEQRDTTCDSRQKRDHQKMLGVDFVSSEGKIGKDAVSSTDINIHT